MIINFHLDSILKLLERKVNDYKLTDFSRDDIVKLMNSFYVDNLVASIDTNEQLHEFKCESVEPLRSTGFDLRG